MERCFAGWLLSSVGCILLAYSAIASARNHQTGICENIVCRAGRECQIQFDGTPKCVCIATCPHHYQPVCGSNDHSYENHCELHRDACLTDLHISVHKKGYCNGMSADIFPLPSDKKDVDDTNSTEQSKPVVCFQNERDHMRQLLIDWLKSDVIDDGWLTKGIDYIHVLKAKFDKCDKNNDNSLDANEFLDCVKENDTATRVREGENAEIVRALCVDALIEVVDSDHDWRLNLDEFESCMDPNYKPPKKKCSLEDRTYDDGAETKVNCNSCICACGNWVCTSFACQTTETNPSSKETLEISSEVDQHELVDAAAVGAEQAKELLTKDEWDELLKSVKEAEAMQEAEKKTGKKHHKKHKKID